MAFAHNSQILVTPTAYYIAFPKILCQLGHLHFLQISFPGVRQDEKDLAPG